MNDSAETQHKSNSPKKKKLCTLNYIHKKLFQEGNESDIKIVALNREWNLHKNFLSQSPYFKCMFSGSWVEKTLKEVNLEIEDVTITSEALHKVFESLYSDEIQVEPTEVVPILACASFFQLNDLTNHCAEVMIACINKDTAVCFLEASDLYDIKEVKNVSFDWLCRNFLSTVYTYPKFLTLIREDLLKELFTTPDLHVSSEREVYGILTTWVFLKENNFNLCYDSVKEFAENSKLYFARSVEGKPFLETDSGISYQSLFRTLRLKNLILDLPYIESWNIFPMEWILPVYREHCHYISRIHKGLDKGPESVSEDIFNRECFRKCFIVVHDRKTERYSFSYFGFELIFRHDNGRLTLKYLYNQNTEINSNCSKCPASSKRGERYLMYRVSLFTVDSDGRVLSKTGTGIKTVSMTPKEKIEVLTFQHSSHHIQFNVNFLLTNPCI